MPLLSSEYKTITAPGLYTGTYNKPTGDKIIIKAIHITSNKNPLFVEVKSYLYKIDKTTHILGVLHKWAISLENMSWNVYREWPEGWKLTVKFATQTNNDTSIVTVEYEIVEVEPKKKGWGQ